MTLHRTGPLALTNAELGELTDWDTYDALTHAGEALRYALCRMETTADDRKALREAFAVLSAARERQLNLIRATTD